MAAFVVDVNVAIVANLKSPQADNECISACIDALEKIVQGGVIVLDDGWKILREYQRYYRQSGQPGLGDYFIKWV